MTSKDIVLAVLFVMSAVASRADGDLKPDQLFCEYLKDPVGIDQKLPELGWTLASSKRDQIQHGYELIVSDNYKDISRAKGNMWATGKVVTSNSIHIPYSGKALKSFTKYFWRVRVYDHTGSLPKWSSIATFETAILDQKEWRAKWIGDGTQNSANDVDRYNNDPMPLFRKQFSVQKRIASARLYISGVGYYEAYLNGRKIGDHLLDPGFTTYRKEVLYVVHDIDTLLTTGKNAIGIMLGNGWWNPLPFKLFGKWALKDYQQTGRPCVKAEMLVRYADGSSESIITDNSWYTTPGPVVKNSVYLGEHYDARLEQADWNRIQANEASWKKAIEVAGPDGLLTVQMQPAIKVTQIVKPQNITRRGKDTFMVDMGRNFAGVVRIKVKGPTGTKVTLRYGEDLFKDGSLNVMTTSATQIRKGVLSGGPGAPETAWQEDGYVLKGDGIEVWSPRFTFHGFRYVEVTGWPGEPRLEDIEGLRMNSDLTRDGAFSCSNSMFNKLHETIDWTFLSNVFSIQSDCPGREKMGYGGDMVATANAFIYDFNMLHFYNKAVGDFANEQRPQGGMTEIAPFTGIDDYGLGDLSGALGWQLAFPFLQKQLYDYYGDKRVIQNNYDHFKKQLAFLQSKAVRNAFYWDISDHLALAPKPEALSACLFYYHHLKLGADFAGILGITSDSLQYDSTAREVKAEAIRKFHVPSTGKFDNATQSAQIFSLWYDLSPEKEKSLKVLMDEFARHNWHLSTGIFTTKMMFDVLRENELNQVAYRVANQRDFPGWGYMLERGATTLWETWPYSEVDDSRNHPMFGSVDEWFYRSLGGINPLSPGFETILIKPQPAGDLTWVKSAYNSIRGRIVSEWSTKEKEFTMHVSIPANTKADVYCPSQKNAVVTQDGNPVSVKQYSNGYAIIEIGSGTYTFHSTR